jgi:uncharacterized membrane-anchored protein YjiN (DUF445 family)
MDLSLIIKIQNLRSMNKLLFIIFIIALTVLVLNIFFGNNIYMRISSSITAITLIGVVLLAVKNKKEN